MLRCSSFAGYTKASVERFLMSQAAYFGPLPPGPIAGPVPLKLVRSTVTRAFLTTDGHWTNQLESAAKFTSHSHALAAVQKFDLRAVELYYLFSEDGPTPYDFTLPLAQPLTTP